MSVLYFTDIDGAAEIRPWINKKIITEYIGEEEATLVDFVCSKVGLLLSTSKYLLHTLKF